ncbi:acyltransferase [Cellulomonas sp. DKR-3]|uniref:Acyltransferase n=1 Tax=Cellulomonas fulva TaxID=2835530 RepID=A0ABS5U2H8_9CELL|nr:acyltransferase family protein [Cellulomonas fulva]MBT0995585.1 acyltransferase [Cellulomonas fulva]
MQQTETPPSVVRAPARERTPRRADVQGLRAVAVLLVLSYHAGLPVPGGFVGVDVFFVISGFLITGLLVDEALTTGRLRLGRFYARRARRLLPAAALTLVGVAAATVVWLPVTRWREIAGDVAATALYVVNWRLADRSVDYLAAGGAASPVQHFWSLAVEEQFYVVWPLLVVALLAVARRRGRRLSRRTLVVAVAVLGLTSLAWSVHLTHDEPARAYFVTTTRAWELAAGALLALAVPRVARLPRRWLTAAGWVGLGLVVLAAATFSGATPFPGVAAAVPVAGALLVLASGVVGAGLAPLRARVLQPVGATSYSLYLWHWPAVVVATSLADGDLPVTWGVAAVAVSVVPAVASYLLVERPLHVRWRATTRAAGALGVVCTLVGLGAAAAVHGLVTPTPATTPPGAQVLRDGGWDGPDAGMDLDTLVPSLADATQDVADLYADGCHQNSLGVEPAACTYGDPGASTVVALVGDSHAGQWQPAVREVAEDNGWRLDTYTKGSCAFTSATPWLSTIDGPYETCVEWNRAVLDTLLADPPDVVVTSNDAVEPAGDDGPLTGAAGEQAVVDGFDATWQELAAAGTRVVVLGDTPWVGIDVPECVARHTGSWASACTVGEEAAAARSGLAQQESAAGTSDVPVLDLTDRFCPDGSCPPIIGGALVWRDAHHMTATYARSLAPDVADWLVPLVGSG